MISDGGDLQPSSYRGAAAAVLGAEMRAAADSLSVSSAVTVSSNREKGGSLSQITSPPTDPLLD